MKDETVFRLANPFAPIDPSKGPHAVSRRAVALSLAVSRAPLSWQGSELFALADKFVAYISGERAEEVAPAAAPVDFHDFGAPVPARKDSAGRIFVWDAVLGSTREVVFK